MRKEWVLYMNKPLEEGHKEYAVNVYTIKGVDKIPVVFSGEETIKGLAKTAFDEGRTETPQLKLKKGDIITTIPSSEYIVSAKEILPVTKEEIIEFAREYEELKSHCL